MNLLSPVVKLQPEGITSYFQFVKLLLPYELVSNMVKYTNNHANMMQNLLEIRQRMKDSSRSLFSLWKPIKMSHGFSFTILLLQRELYLKPHIVCIGLKIHFFSTPVFSRLMRRDRLENDSLFFFLSGFSLKTIHESQDCRGSGRAFLLLLTTTSTNFTGA